MPITPAEFISKWMKVTLCERSAAQQHFLDLCELVDHPKPAAVDQVGDTFTFEKGVTKRGGGDGWADVWKKGFFAWEYKGPHRDLDKAYDQLLLYREALESPPLLVTSNLHQIVIRTNFTGTPTTTYELGLASVGMEYGIRILRAVFHDPEELRPGITSQIVTAEAAAKIGELALALRERGLDPKRVARFLDRIVFCLFAEDVALLPSEVFTQLVTRTRRAPPRFQVLLGELFAAMATGGDYVYDKIAHFDGSLFADADVLPLNAEELARIHAAAQLDWSGISPSIFGTLFERGLDPAKRAQLGAHYTSETDITAIVEPVVMAPLRSEWREVRTVAERLLATGKKHPDEGGKAASPKKARGEAEVMVHAFLTKLSQVKVLDPACGSGNFLYIALRLLKDLEKEVILFADLSGLGSFLPLVGPWQLYGIEINPYAFDLAQMTVWIGYLQWTRANGFTLTQEPILRTMEANFFCRDAILDVADPANPAEPEWPRVDFIVGNPPFLGGKLLRRGLTDEYVDRLFQAWDERVPREADLCCYWFERARAQIEAGACQRAGLLATQGIRGGANRHVLERILASGGIFFAESDRPWVLDGANVHVSMVGFDDGHERSRTLDGSRVAAIHANLSAEADTVTAARLPSQVGLAFMGDTKGGAFDIDEATALKLLATPCPNGRSASDVVVPWVNGLDVTRRPRTMWVIDFGIGMAEAAAAGYDAPFERLRATVQQERTGSRSTTQAWWLHERPRVDMRAALAPVPRFLATARVAKHRLFTWASAPTVADCQLIVFARSDDYFLGVLHSRLHQVWSLAQGTQLREKESGFRYTPTTCFETFPFPWTPGQEPADDPLVRGIADAAADLCRLRDNWLNPPEWTKEEVLEFPATVGGPWDRFIVNPRLPASPAGEVREPDATAVEFALAEHAVGLARQAAAAGKPVRPGDVGLARYPRTVARDADCAGKLAKRTLTNLYNQRPTWLDLAHRRLDAAVCAAYTATAGTPWSPDMPDRDILARLLELNLQRAGAPAPGPSPR